MKHLDKVHHIVYSFALAVVGAFLFGMLVGAGIALLIGAMKEVFWDLYLGRGHPDWWDMAANLVGVVGAIIILGGVF